MLFLAFWMAMQQPDAPVPMAEARLPALRREIETGHAAAALQELDKLLAEPAVGKPALGRIEDLRGQAFYAQGQMAEAADAWAAALTADPGNGEAAAMRGVALYRLGKPAEAITLLERGAGRSEGTTVDPLYVLALCYADTQRWDDARRAWARQYGFGPDSAQAYLLAARLLLRREHLQPARDFGAKALQLDPQIPLAHLLLGEAALAVSDLSSAEKEFETERARNPLEPGVYDRLGDVYTRRGDYPKARQTLEQAVLLEPNATGPYILLGKVLLKQGDAAGAAGYLERARHLDPANSLTRTLLAQTYRVEGRQEEAAAETAAAERLLAGNRPHMETVQ